MKKITSTNIYHMGIETSNKLLEAALLGRFEIIAAQVLPNIFAHLLNLHKRHIKKMLPEWYRSMSEVHILFLCLRF